jgi:hypothetical protein
MLSLVVRKKTLGFKRLRQTVVCETRNETDDKADDLSVTIDNNNNNNNNNHAFKGLGTVDRFGPNITTHQPLQWATSVPFSCWLLFHNGDREPKSVHPTDM